MRLRRTTATILLIPIVFPFSHRLLDAQETQANREDAEWLVDCREGDEHGDDDPRACEVVVDSVPGAAELIVVESTRNGGVEVRGWDRAGIEVHARIQARGDTPAAALERVRNFRLELAPGRVRVVGDENRGAVSFEILVPRRSGLEVETHNGPLGIEGVEGTMRLGTQNVPLSLVGVGGQVTARVKNGPIKVELDGDRWRGAGLDAETVNGPVRLQIPENYSAELEVGTIHGPFDADIPITLEPGVRFPGHVRTRLGGGGPRVRVVTTNGPMVVRRS